jgi:hypothetical protein
MFDFEDNSCTKQELNFLITIARMLALFATFSHSFDFEDNSMMSSWTAKEASTHHLTTCA